MPLPQQVTGVGISGATAAGSAMATAPAPADSTLFNSSAGGIASITFPATPGKAWLITYISGSITQNSPINTPFTNVFLLYNGNPLASGGVSVKGSTWLYAVSGLAIFNNVNTAVTITFSIGFGDAYQAISASAYLI